MSNDTQALIKRLFKDCKLCLLTAATTLIVTALLSKLRLGRILPFKVKGTPYKSLNSFSPHIHDCFDVFRWENTRTLVSARPGVRHDVFVVDNVRVAAWIHGGGLHVVIRGSNNEDNWAANLNTDTETHKGTGMNVHKAYDGIAKGIANVIKTKYKDLVGCPAYLRGGSLGGALSVLTAQHLSGIFTVQEVVSVGGPKVGATRFNLPLTNIRHEQDPVPYLPMWNAIQGWDHDGTTLLIKRDGSVWRLENSFRTDLSLSLVYLEEELDPSTHTAYRQFVNQS